MGGKLLSWCFHSVSSSAIDVRVVRHMIIVQLATDTCHMIPTLPEAFDGKWEADSQNVYRCFEFERLDSFDLTTLFFFFFFFLQSITVTVLLLSTFFIVYPSSPPHIHSSHVHPEN